MVRAASPADESPVKETGAVDRRCRSLYAKGRHSLMRATMVSWTWPSLPSLRLRFELLLEARWRRPGLRRISLPVPVTLIRFAAAFFVLRRATDLGIVGAGKVAGRFGWANSFFGGLQNLF